MALLPEHETYLESLSAALSTWVTALSQALTIQDSPTEYHLSDIATARDGLSEASRVVNGFIAGIGQPSDPAFPAPPLNDDLKLYKVPGSGLQPIASGSLLANPAVMPRLL